MFDFSFAEIAIVVVVAVLFIGPDELPVVIRAVGKAMRTIRGLTREMRELMEEITKESGLNDVAKDLQEITMIKGDDGKMYEAYMMPTSVAKKDPEPEKKPELP